MKEVYEEEGEWVWHDLDDDGGGDVRAGGYFGNILAFLMGIGEGRREGVSVCASVCVGGGWGISLQVLIKISNILRYRENIDMHPQLLTCA